MKLLREQAQRPILATLADHLADQRLVLVLDNCEHLLEAAAALAGEVLRVGPGARVLATSRAGLGLSGAAMVFAALGAIAPTAGALLQEAVDVAVILNALRASR